MTNSRGDLLTPSAVLFDDDGVVVGKEAGNASVVEPTRFADCFKRDIGGSTYHRRIRNLEVPPEILSAFLLRQLKQDAEQRLGPIQQAVITVPAFFDESRRKATQDAGRLAGLEVLDIINEPTAAALAFSHHFALRGSSASDGRQRMLVYDLGGGTFDVTVLEVEGQRCRALATDGDVRLGGRDFDERLMEYLATEFSTAHGMDPRSDPQDAAQLWLDAQEAKHTLSQRTKASVVCAHAGIRMRIDLTRELFEEMTSHLLERTEMTTLLVLKDAGLTWSDIDRVLLVGGAARMPAVGEMLRRISGKEPDRSLSPDEAVAHGAALYADALVKEQQGAEPSARLINVNSHSLGVVGVDSKTKMRTTCVFVPKNTPLPVRASRSFATHADDQRSVKVSVVEGESHRPEDCIYLGECVVRDLPEGLPKGTPVLVDFSYAANGRIAVSARVPAARQSATVELDRRHRPQLEDLETWSDRVQGLESSDSSANDEGPPVRHDDHASVLRRLDFLHSQIGKVALRVSLPHPLSKSQQAAIEAANQLAELQTKLDGAEQSKNAAPGASDALLRGAEYAKLKSAWEQQGAQADFARLVLGRDCVHAECVPSAAQKYESEARQLEALLRS